MPLLRPLASMRRTAPQSIRRTTRLTTATLTVLAAAHAASAQTLVRWASGISGNYTDPANWTGPVPNTTAFDALIDAPGTYEIFPPSNQTLTLGKLTFNASGARFRFAQVVATRGVEVTQGGVGFSRLVAPFLVTADNTLTGRVAISGNDFDVADYGGTVSLSGSTISATVNLRPSTLLYVNNPLSFTSFNARLQGTGTLFLQSGSLIGRPDSPLEIGPGITVRSDIYPDDFARFNVQDVVLKGTLIADKPDFANSFSFTDLGSFRGRNEGTIRSVARSPLLRQFTGTNAGLIELTGFDGTATIPLTLSNFTNTGTTTLTRIRAAFVGTPNIASGSTFQIIDGELNLDGTGINTPASLNGITLTNSRLNPGSVFDIGGATLATAAYPLRINGGTVRNGTLSGPAGSVSSVNGTLENIRLDVPAVLDSASLKIAGTLELMQPLTFDDLIGDGYSVLNASQNATVSGTAPLKFISRILATRSVRPVTISVTPGAILTLAPNLNTTVDSSQAFFSSTNNTPDSANPATVLNLGTLTLAPNAYVVVSVGNFTNQGLLRLQNNATLAVTLANVSRLGALERSPSAVIRLRGTENLGTSTLDLSTSPAGPLDLESVTFTGGRLISPGRTVSLAGGSPFSISSRFTNTTLSLEITASGGALIAGSPILDNATINLSYATFRPDSRTVTGTGSIVFRAAESWLSANNIPATISLLSLPGAVGKVATDLGTAVRLDGPIHALGGEFNFGTVVFAANITELNNDAIASDGGRIYFNQPTTISPTGSLTVRTGATAGMTRTHNLGTIQIESGAVVTLGPTNNLGTVVVGESSTLRIRGPITGNPIQLDGTLIAASPDVSVPVMPIFGQGAEIGVLLGNSYTNSGTLAFSSPLNANGLNVVIEGSPALVPFPGSTLNIITYPSRIGDFGSILFRNTPPAITLTPSVGPTSISVFVTANFPGDANLDAFVGPADLQILGQYFGWWGVNWTSGNFNGDFIVDIKDLQILTLNWQGTPDQYFALIRQYNLPWVPLPIPEPSSLALLAMSIPLLGRTRRLRP